MLARVGMYNFDLTCQLQDHTWDLKVTLWFTSFHSITPYYLNGISFVVSQTASTTNTSNFCSSSGWQISSVNVCPNLVRQ